jgi:hypothetical protein
MLKFSLIRFRPAAIYAGLKYGSIISPVGAISGTIDVL